MDLKIQDGIALYKSGEKDKAARLFYRIASAEPENEKAWLWLAASVDDVNKKRYSFQKALAINPNNLAVRNELAALEKQINMAAAEVVEDRPAALPTVTVVETVDPTARPGYYIPPTYQVNYPDQPSAGLEPPPKIILQKNGVPARLVFRILFDFLLIGLGVAYLFLSRASFWPVNLLLQAGKVLYKIYEHIGLVTLAYVPIEHGDYLAEGLIVFAVLNFFMPNKVKTVFGVIWIAAGVWIGYSVIFLTQGSPALWNYIGMILLFTFAIIYTVIGLLRLIGIAEEPPEEKFEFSSSLQR